MAPTNVPAVVDGVVGDVKVKVGDSVKEGDLVAIQHVGKVRIQIRRGIVSKLIYNLFIYEDGIPD